MNTYYQILNFSIFFYFLVYNMKNYDKTFYEVIFEKRCKFIKMIIKILNYTKRSEGQVEVLKLFTNLILDEDIISTFKSMNLEDIYNYNVKKFNYVIKKEYKLSPLNEITNSIHKRLLEFLINLDFTYEQIFKGGSSNNINSNSNSNSTSIGINSICLHEDKPLVKSMLVQSIIRIVLSKEKYKFINPNLPYESFFLKNLTKKCVLYYHEKFGENVNCLFRREEIFDDLIKFFFFIYGNAFFYKSCYVHLKNVVDKYTISDSMTDILYLTQDEFIIFYEDLLQKMRMYIPNALKIILKLIYENVLEIYSSKIQANNFSPVLTILFFNFFISPKIQEIYNISPTKNVLIRNLNRVIRNICFNEKFKEGDPLQYYNEIIEICHIHTSAAIDKILTSFIVDDMDFIIKNEMESNKKFVEMPPYLFYHDADYVLRVLECPKLLSGKYDDLSKEVDLVEKILNNSRKSTFFVKINMEDFKKLKILDDEEDNLNLNSTSNNTEILSCVIDRRTRDNTISTRKK
jgi:hypothetical protein